MRLILNEVPMDELLKRYFPNGIGLIPFELGNSGKEKPLTTFDVFDTVYTIAPDEEPRGKEYAVVFIVGLIGIAVVVFFALVIARCVVRMLI